MLTDAMKYYLDFSEREDIMNISYGGQYDYVSYKNMRALSSSKVNLESI